MKREYRKIITAKKLVFHPVFSFEKSNIYMYYKITESTFSLLYKQILMVTKISVRVRKRFYVRLRQISHSKLDFVLKQKVHFSKHTLYEWQLRNQKAVQHTLFFSLFLRHAQAYFLLFSTLLGVIPCLER